MDRALSAAGATLDFKQPVPDELPDTFPRGRRCSACDRPLSIYNPGSACWAHQVDDDADVTLAQLMRAA